MAKRKEEVQTAIYPEKELKDFATLELKKGVLKGLDRLPERESQVVLFYFSRVALIKSAIAFY